MSPVDADLLEPAEDLWWFWAVLAATHQAIGNDTGGLREEDTMLRLDTAGGSWLRMQRLRGDRAVLWGRDVDSEDDALTAGLDVLDAVPDWAVTDALSRSVHIDGVGFLAWSEDGAWTTSTPAVEDGSDFLLEPLMDIGAIAREVKLVHHGALIDVLPRVIADARVGALSADTFQSFLRGSGDAGKGHALLVAARAEAEPAGQAAAHDHLRAEIHTALREGEELPGRTLPDSPVVLVQWARVSGLDTPFEHAVLVERGRMMGAPDNPVLPEQFGVTLTNVLHQLHHSEAGEESGAWIFARVSYDGTRITFERRFDSWPEWYRTQRTAQGPSLEALAWEMSQRSEAWRPVWTSRLPPA